MRRPPLTPLLGLLVLLAGMPVRAEEARLLPPAERGLPRMRMFLPRDYRGHDQIWAIAETREGVLLFAHLNAVSEFDGQTWRTIPVPGGSYLRAMQSDATGTVWVAGDNEFGRLVPGPDGRLAYESLRAQVPAEIGELGPIWKIFARSDGVYFQGNAALLRWDGANFEAWKIGSTRTALAFPFEDTVLVCADFGWRLARPGGQWETVGTEALVPWGPRFLLPQPDGTWLAGTGAKGVRRLLRDGTHTAQPTPIDDWLLTCRPYTALELADGRRVFCSIQGGVMLTAPDLAPEFWLAEPAGLPSRTVISAYQDRRGVLWLGTDRGVVRVEVDSPVTVFNEAHGIGRGALEGLERVDGRLTITGTMNVLEFSPPAKATELARFNPQQKDGERVAFLLRLPEGTLVAELTGVTWRSEGRIEKIESPPGVREVVEWRGQPGRFIGTHLGGLCSWRRAEGKWIYEGEWKDVTGELRGLVQDGQGRVWTSTANAGLLRVTPARDGGRAERVERMGEAEGLPFRRARVWLDEIGGAPLFRTEGGMFRFAEAAGRFVPERQFGGRFGDGVTRVRLVAADDRGGLWAAIETSDSQPSEIVYVRDGREERLPLTGFSDLGALGFVTWDAKPGHEVLWLGGESELWQVDLVRWRRQSVETPGATLLRGISVGGRAHDLAAGQPMRFAAEENSLRIAFATPGLAGESRPRHESRLVGFRDGEAEIAVGSERTFTNLPVGDYVFEVRGLSEDGRGSEPARLAFTILAPWWQTPWALGGYALAAGGLLFAYIRWRVRRLTREQRRLESLVAARTAELAAKNLELERLHRVDEDEKLAARLAEERAQLELLRYQLNPHFLYNSLNSIRALVYANAEAAGEMVTRLAEFCRWTLTRGGDGMTTVAEEVEMLKAYLDIERTRWQEGLQVRIELDPVAQREGLPQFLFLPLLENAIKYGGRTSPGVLEVTIMIRAEGTVLVCEIGNSGEWVPPTIGGEGGESTRIGLDNLKRRLARHYGAGTEPEVVLRPGWVCVRLRLPRTVREPARGEEGLSA